MIVRRIKGDELYHHGVKGQRWGKRKAVDTTQTRTGDSSKDPRTHFIDNHPFDTGKSKGVHRRTDHMGMYERADGSLVRMDGKSAIAKNKLKPVGSESIIKRQQGPNAVKKTNSKAINDKYNQQQKAFEKNQHEHVKVNEGKSFTYKGVYYPNGKSEAENERRVQQRYGKDYKMDDPTYTPFDKDGAKQAWEAKQKEDAADKRRIEYKDAAFAKSVENEFRIKESKKVINKLKLFGKSFKEVHSENIKKGANVVKKIFKRK